MGLTASELRLLREKQRRLRSTAVAISDSLPPGRGARNVLEATLIFAQYEAGTAVCIDAAGWVLTCAHCFGETREECEANKRRWLLFFTGTAVQVECRAWDAKRDLALLKIIAIGLDASSVDGVPPFPFVRLATRAPGLNASIMCIGQPGRDDLECTSAQRTKYNLVEVSQGKFRGMLLGADPQDNSNIGSLKHDAWTYWGHSGAPLLLREEGTLVGLHSSWDDQTAMRHGVPLVAVQSFLREQGFAPTAPARPDEAEPILPSPGRSSINDGSEGLSVDTAIVIDDDGL